jgi:hypothetical protein
LKNISLIPDILFFAYPAWHNGHQCLVYFILETDFHVQFFTPGKDLETIKQTTHKENGMKTGNHSLHSFIASFLMFFFLFIPPLAFAEKESNGMSLNQDVLVAQGQVKNFNQEQQTLALKTSKGERLTILFDWNTALVGYSSLAEIEKGHKVKIWYTVEENKNTAVKIEKSLDVGC